MFKIEKTDYGFKLTFKDFMSLDETFTWVSESRQMLNFLKKKNRESAVLMDVQTLQPMAPEVADLFRQGQDLYKDFGMTRSVVVSDSQASINQLKQLFQNSAFAGIERYIDTTRQNNWEQLGFNWLLNGIDPQSPDFSLH